MQERDFSIYDQEKKVRITGGVLWKINKRGEDGQMWQLDSKTKTLSVFLQPNDQLNDIKEGLFELIREHNWRMHLYFEVQKRVPSLLLLVPASLTVWLICFGSLLGDTAIAVAFTEGGDDTIFGISRLWLFLIMGAIATLMLYSFPAFFSGEQDGFIQYIYNRFSQRSIIRERFRKAFSFLRARGVVGSIVIWNPHLGEEQADWVTQSLMPAVLDAGVNFEMHVKIDERSAAQNLVARMTKRGADEIVWEEHYFDEHANQAIPYDYLENWEKRLLAIYAFASTANLPSNWKNMEQPLKNVVSLPLVALIVEQFKERLFAEADRQKLISLDTFASRCVNDLGILSVCTVYSRPMNELWEIEQTIIDNELSSAQDEMRFVMQFLETNIKNVSEQIDDLVTALLVNSLYAKVSIYNPKRLLALRYFIQTVRDTEQYKIFNKYWDIVAAPPASLLAQTTSEADVYRIVGVNWLIDLAVLFEKAAQYERAETAYRFIEEVYPYRGKIGRAKVAEKRGNYLESTLSMLEIVAQYEQKTVELSKVSLIDLNLNLAWAIVSGRLEAHKLRGLQALADAKKYLHVDYDQIRNSDQMTRLYNITANYEEWAGRQEGSIDNYDNALRIPGAEQWNLSNILVNKGIALRQVGRLKEGAHFGEQGVEIKTAIGDADQLPIALHNLTQTYIMLAYSLPTGEQQKYFTAALHHAQTGLNIQDRTGSVKKRGQLLAEHFIAAYALQPQDTAAADALLRLAQAWLSQEIAAGRADTYDVRVVKNELLGIVPSAPADVLTWRII